MIVQVLVGCLHVCADHLYFRSKDHPHVRGNENETWCVFNVYGGGVADVFTSAVWTRLPDSFSPHMSLSSPLELQLPTDWLFPNFGKIQSASLTKSGHTFSYALSAFLWGRVSRYFPRGRGGEALELGGGGRHIWSTPESVSLPLHRARKPLCDRGS